MNVRHPYADILALSQRMLLACRAQAWDELTRLEHQRAALFGTDRPSMPPGQMATVAAAIRQILASDEEITERVSTWMEHTRILLRMPPRQS